MFKKYILPVFVLSTFTIQAQETITTSGGNVISTEGSVSYSIGQTFYITSQGINGSVSEGVQQPYEISVLSGKDIADIDLRLAVYPNPVADILYLDVRKHDYTRMSYILFDINRRVIKEGILKDETTSIHMDGLPSATYFLYVKSGRKEIKTFKIIKQ